MLCKVIVGTVGYAPKLAPSEREKKFKIGGCLRIEAEFVLVVVPKTQVFFFKPEVKQPLAAEAAPVLEPFKVGARLAEELKLHLLKLTGSENKVSGSYLIAEGLSYLSHSEGYFPAGCTGDIFEVHENELKVVSLDGHRISIRKVELKDSYEDKKVVVPGKSLQEVSKILSGEMEDEVRIFFTANHIVFEFDETTVVSRLIEGEYFKINQMLSSDYETKFTINKKEFLSCIDRATLLIKEGDKKPIIFRITDQNMEININSQLGSMKEDIDIQKEGRDIMIGFNPKFLIDALRVIDDEIIYIYMVNPKAPCYIKDEEGRYIYLILPVNFNAAVN